MQRHLERRFLSLAAGEAVSVLVFAFFYFNFRQNSGSQFDWGLLYPFLLLEFLLLQGSVYWLCRWLRLRSGFTTNTPGVIRSYWVLHKLNAVLLLALPIVIWRDPAHLFGSLFLGGFALIEFINYFYWRLAYSPSEFLSRLAQLRFPASVLAQELRTLR